MPARKVVKTPPGADDDSAESASAWQDGQQIIEDGTVPDFAEPAGAKFKPCGPADAGGKTGGGALEGCAKFACITCAEEDVASNMTVANYHENGHRSFRCRPCNGGRVRVGRMLRVHPSIEDLSDSADKASMVKDAKKLYGNSLVAHMRSKVTKTDESSLTVSMIGNGNFMDLEDLQAKYEKKPNKLAAVIKNTSTFWDPVSESLLYEDMSYSSNRVDCASRKRQNETVLDDINPKKIKAVGKPKADKATDAEPNGKKAAEPNNKPLSPKQCEALSKTITVVSALVQKLQTTVQPLEDPANTWVQHVPKYVGDGAQLAVAHANALCVDESARIRRSMIL